MCKLATFYIVLSSNEVRRYKELLFHNITLEADAIFFKFRTVIILTISKEKTGQHLRIERIATCFLVILWLLYFLYFFVSDGRFTE